MAKMRD